MPANLENSVSSHRTGKGQFSFQSQRKAMPKNAQTTTQLWSFHMLARYWRRQCQPTLVLLPGKSHGQRSLVGCSPWGRKELDTTEQLNWTDWTEMFFWNSLTFSIIQQMLAIWSLVPLPLLNPAWTSVSLWFMYCWSLAWRILSMTLLVCGMSAIVW